MRSHNPVGLLKAKDIGGGEEVTKARRDNVAAMNEVGRGAVVGEAINIIGNDAGNRKGKIGREEERGGRTSRAKRTARHKF